MIKVFEWLFFSSVIVFAICFIAGVFVTLKYDSEAEKLFKWYNQIVNIMTWAVFILIPAGAILLLQKVFAWLS